MRVARRLGFTIVELLVVVAIIGVLVGLMLPAVQSTRENARMISCRNNLINVHLAVEAYHGAFGRFPAGTMTDRLPARMFPDGKDHSWWVQVRPMLDGGLAFAEQWSPVHSAYHPRNWALAYMTPPPLACPSSPFMHRNHMTPLSYVGIHDGVDAPIDTNSGGFFAANRFLRRGDISDGLSHTLQLGEIRVDLGNTFFWIAGNQSTLRTTGLPMDFLPDQNRWGGGMEERTSIAYGRFADPETITYEMLTSRLASASEQTGEVEAVLLEIRDSLSKGDADSSSALNPALLETTPPFTLPQVGPDAIGALPLGSTHSALVHGVFADGRVIAINQAIDRKLYSQLGIRNDGMPLEKPLVQIE
jgi:prepilin-type N-terminal cleavage/methylation domain-containing protein